MDKSAPLNQLIEEQYARHLEDRPFIVAMDGLSGAGKTTLVNHLKNNLNNSVIIHIDDHIVEREKRYETGQEEWFEYYQLQWNTKYLSEHLFEALHGNKGDVTLPFYNKETDTTMRKKIRIFPRGIVIIEGIFLLRTEWKPYYDYIIFLDCPREIRSERVLERDTYIGDLEERLKKYKNRYWLAEDYYVKEQKPLDLAHYVYQTGRD